VRIEPAGWAGGCDQSLKAEHVKMKNRPQLKIKRGEYLQ
jgi:hypothetical protein